MGQLNPCKFLFSSKLIMETKKKDQLIILTCNKCQMHVCFSIDALLSDSVCGCIYALCSAPLYVQQIILLIWKLI